MTRAETDRERWQRLERRNSVPDNEVAGPIALDAVLGRTPTLAVVLLTARVFSTGIELELMTRLRRVGEAPDSGLHHHRRGPVRPDGVDDVMQFAVEYSDGGRRAEARRGGWDDEDDEKAPVLRMAQFSSSDTMQDSRYWLAPLPDVGDVTVVFSWLYRGMPETRTVISAATLARARAEVVVLWPCEPEAEPD